LLIWHGTAGVDFGIATQRFVLYRGGIDSLIRGILVDGNAFVPTAGLSRVTGAWSVAFRLGGGSRESRTADTIPVI